MNKKNIMLLSAIGAFALGIGVAGSLVPHTEFAKAEYNYVDNLKPNTVFTWSDFAIMGGADDALTDAAHVDTCAKCYTPVWGRHFKMKLSILLYSWTSSKGDLPEGFGHQYTAEETDNAFTGYADNWLAIGFTTTEGGTRSETREGVPSDDSHDLGCFFNFRNISPVINETWAHVQFVQKLVASEDKVAPDDDHIDVLNESKKVTGIVTDPAAVNKLGQQPNKVVFEFYRADGKDKDAVSVTPLATTQYMVKFSSEDGTVLHEQALDNVDETKFINSDGSTYFGLSNYEHDKDNGVPGYDDWYGVCQASDHLPHRGPIIYSIDCLAKKVNNWGYEIDERNPHTGKVNKAKVKITADGEELVLNTDYNVIYSPSAVRNIGVYQMTIKFIGSYKGYEDLHRTYEIYDGSATSSEEPATSSEEPTTSVAPTESSVAPGQSSQTPAQSSETPAQSSETPATSSEKVPATIWESGCFGSVGATIVATSILLAATGALIFKKKRIK